MTDLDLLRSRIVDVADFPTPGIVFKDISPLLADHDAFSAAVDAVVAHHEDARVDKVVGMYLLILRPQRARAKQLAQVRSGLAVGARVITTAGLHAQVVELADDGTALLEIAPGVRARFLQQAVVQVLEPAPGDPA